MPRRPRNYATMPIDPTYRSVWEKAAAKPPLHLNIETKTEAIRFRAQLYEQRKILEAKEDPLFFTANTLAISITQDPESGWIIIISSKDAGIKASLAQQGIGTMEAPDFEADL